MVMADAMRGFPGLSGTLSFKPCRSILPIDSCDIYETVRVKYRELSIVELHYTLLPKGAEDTIDMDKRQSCRVPDVLLGDG